MISHRSDRVTLDESNPVEEPKRADERLRLLVRAGQIFHRSLDLHETLANVARLMASEFADLCIIDLLEGPDELLSITAAAHRDPRRDSELLDVASLLYNNECGVHPAVRVTQTGESYFVQRLDDGAIAAEASSSAHAEFMRRMGYCSKIVVPVTANAEVFGAMTVVLTGGDRFFDGTDLEFSEELGRRAGLAVLNAQQYMRERHVAATLQQAFMPQEFPVRPGVSFDALYRPGKGDATLGGDWYDAFETRRGDIVVAIGDVTGNGVQAARTMVQLREAVRVASVRTVDPADILCMANDALFVESGDRYASAWVGVLPASATTMTYASAGHPPPFVRYRDGRVVQLRHAGQMLGVLRDCEIQNEPLAIEPGMLLVLYTDGLTEIGHDVVAGEREIAQVLLDPTFAANPLPARALERAIVDGPAHDDLAILTLRFA